MAIAITHRKHPTTRTAVLDSLIVAVVLTGGTYLVALLAGWIDSINPLEAFAVFTSYSCTYLCVVEKRINYPIGALSTAAYCILFWQSGLFASALLNAYLTPSLLYGWFRWRSDKAPRPVSWVKPRWYAVYALVTAVAYFGVYFINKSFGGEMAALDTGILIGSILAQLLLDNKKMENWIIWLLVDIVATWEYFGAGLTLAGFQYVFFLLNTILGFYVWNKSRKASTDTTLTLGAPSPAQDAVSKAYVDGVQPQPFISKSFLNEVYRTQEDQRKAVDDR